MVRGCGGARVNLRRVDADTNACLETDWTWVGGVMPWRRKRGLLEEGTRSRRPLGGDRAAPLDGQQLLMHARKHKPGTYAQEGTHLPACCKSQRPGVSASDSRSGRQSSPCYCCGPWPPIPPPPLRRWTSTAVASRAARPCPRPVPGPAVLSWSWLVEDVVPGGGGEEA